MNKYAIILAGGQGLRMQSDVPKQFLEIEGKPIIVHTIERFIQYDKSIHLIVVLPSDQMDLWNNINKLYFTNLNIKSTTGGETRSESVRKGLIKIDTDGLVAIHDAVRPFVPIKSIDQSYNSAEKHGSGVVAIHLKDSIREVVNNKTEAKNRDNFRLVQTPQTFKVAEIKQAYEKIYSYDFKDDASLYEAAGFEVKLVPGSFKNIKITTQDDI